MRHIKVAIIFLVSFVFIACGQSETDAASNKSNSKISWTNIQDGAEKALNDDKMIFVYVHTDWCSWCKKMEEETFSDEAIVNYMNDKFVPVSLDAESQKQVRFNGQQMSEQEVASTLGAEGFPTHVFLTSEGQPVTVAPGYLPPERFINVLSFIAEDHYKNMDWEDYVGQQEG